MNLTTTLTDLNFLAFELLSLNFLIPELVYVYMDACMCVSISVMHLYAITLSRLVVSYVLLVVLLLFLQILLQLVVNFLNNEGTIDSMYKATDQLEKK